MNLLPFVAILFILGLYCLLAKGNLIKILIGLELLGKATILAIIWAGVIQNNLAFTQSMALIIIAVEVMVVAVFLALAYAFYRKSNTLDTDEMRKLKG
jgi:NADH-quinone oxidoreductase subunit K